MFTFQPNLSNFCFLNFAFPDSAIFKNTLFFLHSEIKFDQKKKKNRNLGDKRRFGYA